MFALPPPPQNSNLNLVEEGTEMHGRVRLTYLGGVGVEKVSGPKQAICRVGWNLNQQHEEESRHCSVDTGRREGAQTDRQAGRQTGSHAWTHTQAHTQTQQRRRTHVPSHKPYQLSMKLSNVIIAAEDLRDFCRL